VTGAPRQVGIHEAKTHLSRLLRDVEGGAEIILTRDGRPVARITSVPDATSVSSSYGLFKGQFELPADFDADSAELADLFGVPR
jgi:prevent-host-death family protein